MKRIHVLIGILIFITGTAVGQALISWQDDIKSHDPSTMTPLAYEIVASWSRLLPNARSAGQISQISDEARTQLDFIQVRQNDEIIRLLRKIAGETK